MNLEDLDIKGIIASMPDPAHIIMRLAPQEIDRLASVLYLALEQSVEQVRQQNLSDPGAIHKVFYDSISDQLESIESDLAVKNLAEKIDMEFILEKILS
jgi:hypothetical protein